MEKGPNNSNPFTLETSQYIRIPLKRIGAVIGVKGAHKELIEGKTKTLIIIDSDTGEVEIRPGSDLKDPVQLFNARDIVKAIGRGFSVDQAIKLAEDEYFLEIIRLKPIVGDKYNQLRRVRGRLIGTQGKIRKLIEELTGVSLMVSGSTVSIVGTYQQISNAREAAMEIIKGANIESVIGTLENKRRQIKKAEKELWEDESDLPPDEKDIDEEDPFVDYEED